MKRCRNEGENATNREHIKAYFTRLSREGGYNLFIIDRFEGKRSEWAIIRASNSQTFKLPRLILPANTWAGDPLSISVTIDEEVVDKRRYQYEKFLKKLFDE